MAKHEQFAQRLRDLRKATEMTQEQLADKGDVPVWSLRNWEGGRRMPSLGAAFALAKALGVPLERLGEVAEVWERTPPAKAKQTVRPKAASANAGGLKRQTAKPKQGEAKKTGK